MLEFIIEVVAQTLLEGLFELIVEGWRAISGSNSPTKSSSADRRSQSGVRNVVTLLVGALLAIGLGILWGRHAKSVGRSTPPLAIWFSLLSAVVLGLTAWWRRSNPPHQPFRRLQPWTWSPRPLIRMAVVNIGGAIGVAVGFAITAAPLR
jgi:uncharacterized membrane protein YfcA